MILTVECSPTHYKYKYIRILALTTLKKATRTVEPFGGHYPTKLCSKTEVRLLFFNICIYTDVCVCVCVYTQGYSK